VRGAGNWWVGIGPFCSLNCLFLSPHSFSAFVVRKHTFIFLWCWMDPVGSRSFGTLPCCRCSFYLPIRVLVWYGGHLYGLCSCAVIPQFKLVRSFTRRYMYVRIGNFALLLVVSAGGLSFAYQTGHSTTDIRSNGSIKYQQARQKRKITDASNWCCTANKFNASRIGLLLVRSLRFRCKWQTRALA